MGERGLRRRTVLAVAAVVTYNSWIVWFLSGNVWLGYLSELAADDQPFSWFFRLGDVLAAIVFSLIALAGRRGWKTWLGPWAPRAAGVLAFIGAATILDAAINLPCAESLDDVCAATPSLARLVHTAASVMIGLAFVALLVIVAVALHQQQGWQSRAVIGVSVLAVVTSCLLAVSAAPWVAVGTQGATQAAQVVLCSLWVAYMAWRLSDDA